MASTVKFDNRQFSTGASVQMIKQVVEARSSGSAKTSSNSSTQVTIMSTSITVEDNSKLFLWFHAHYSQSHAQDNPVIEFFVDGTKVGEWDTKHYFYNDTGNTGTFRPVVDLPFVTPTLSAGSHTIDVKFYGSQGNGTLTFDAYIDSYPNRAHRLIIMEISG